ncbi:MAG: TraR/DksA C4-type zinc finger protein [Patescibacteria group bacterium]
MDEQLIIQLKEELQKEKADVEKALGVISDKDVGEEVPGDFAPRFPNYGDDYYTELEDNSPTEVSDYTVIVDSTGELESYLTKIEEAIEKIDTEKFGYCEKCNESITDDRLKANPTAKTCVNCMQK